MTVFNQDGRIKNSLKTSSVNLVYQLLNTLLSFAYRTIFIKILAVEFLGLNGLFTDILNLLSLAELGIGTSIAFRLYKPIHENDIEHVAKLMAFFKKIYWIIAAVITSVGLLIMPIIPYVINASSNIPAEINLYLLYSIFLFQSVSGYFFAYKQTLLNADQRAFTLTIYNILSTVLRFAGQIAILYIFKNYLWTLVYTVVWNILSNYIVSLLISQRYKEVFKLKVSLSKSEQKEILKDTGALVMHKVGGVVLSSTDSIVITAMVGLAVNGILSNYLMIIGVLRMIYAQLFAGVGAGLGNICSTGDTIEIRRVFKNLNFISLWLTGFICIGLMCLLNPFIEIWLKDETYILSNFDIIFLIISVYMQLARSAINTLIISAGEFTRDKFRPIIEAGINIIISVVLAKFIGLKGVYVGTIVSFALTAFWREIYIGSKYVLKQKQINYWKVYLTFVVMTIIAGLLTFYAINYLPKGIGFFILKLLIVIIIPNLFFTLCTFKLKEFKYFYGMILNTLTKLIHKIFKRKANVINYDGEVIDNFSQNEKGSIETNEQEKDNND